MRHFLIILFLLLSCNYSFAQTKILVDEEIITDLDITNRMKLLSSFGENDLSGKDQQKKLRDHVIKSLIEEKLVKKEAKKYKLYASDIEISHYIANIEQSSNAKNGDFMKKMHDKNINKEIVLDFISSKVLFSKLINYVLSATVTVSDKEIEEILGTIIPDNAMIDFKQITPKPDSINSQEEYDITIEKLNNIRGKISKCADIEKLSSKAKLEVSDMKLSIRSLQPELQEVVRILPLGKASSIINSNAGPQVIVVCKRDYSDLSKEDREAIRNTVIDRKLEKQSVHYINKLRQKAFVEIIQ